MAHAGGLRSASAAPRRAARRWRRAGRCRQHHSHWRRRLSGGHRSPGTPLRRPALARLSRPPRRRSPQLFGGAAGRAHAGARNPAKTCRDPRSASLAGGRAAPSGKPSPHHHRARCRPGWRPFPAPAARRERRHGRPRRPTPWSRPAHQPSRRLRRRQAAGRPTPAPSRCQDRKCPDRRARGTPAPASWPAEG